MLLQIHDNLAVTLALRLRNYKYFIAQSHKLLLRAGIIIHYTAVTIYQKYWISCIVTVILKSALDVVILTHITNTNKI